MIFAPHWYDIALRLACVFLASAMVGLDRESHERAAGLRTNVLVGVSAAIAMICAIKILPTMGKEPGSFVQIDVMRLPLGVLTGMGFIGAGAIIRRDGLTLGVTTAATLWYVTVMGLCFGAGQFGLGFAALALAITTLWGLKWVEGHLRRQKEGRLFLRLSPAGPDEAALRHALTEQGVRVRSVSAKLETATGMREYYLEMWYPAQDDGTLSTPGFVSAFAGMPGLERIEWEVAGH